MNRKVRVIALAVITGLVVMAVPLTAQQSNTNQATAGLFRTDADNFVSTTRYGEVEFDKWFSYVGGGYINSNTVLDVGYARRLGSLYLGLNYLGNFITQTPGSTTTKGEVDEIKSTYDDNGVNTEKETTESNLDRRSDVRNGITALIGVAGMGIKVGFAENLQFLDGPNEVTPKKTEYPGSPEIKYEDQVVDFSRVKGSLYPYLGWGMKLDLGTMTLYPKVDVTVDFQLNNGQSILKNYNTLNGSLKGEEISALQDDVSVSGNPFNGATNLSQNHIRPNIAVGADVMLQDTGSTQLWTGVTYGIAFSLYNNSYDVFGFSDSTSGYVTLESGYQRIAQGDWGNNEEREVEAALDERTSMTHTITPSFKVVSDFNDRLKVGFGIDPMITITSSTTTSWTKTSKEELTAPTAAGLKGTKTTTITETGKAEEEYTNLVISPALSFGLTYAVVPDRFSVNAGVGANFSYQGESTRTKPAGFGSKTTTKVDANGNETTTIDVATVVTTVQDDKLVVDNRWTGLKPNASVGFTLFFGPNASLDAAFSATNVNNTIGINFSAFSVLFTLKK